MEMLRALVLTPTRSRLTVALLMATLPAFTVINGQDSSGGHKPQPQAGSALTREDIEQLQRTIAAQEAQLQAGLDAIRQENLLLKHQLEQTEKKLSVAELKIHELDASEGEHVKKQQENAALVATTVKTNAIVKDLEHPTALRYKGITIAPGGYFAAEGLFRTHAENTDFATSFSGVPYDSQTMAHISEFRASARQTRLTVLGTGATGNIKVAGYFETDFEGSGSGASEVQTNGYSNRIRQIWGRVELPNSWTFTGGQMWSLLTTNSQGIQNLKELTTPLVDSSQWIGSDYARQTAFRVTKAFDTNKVTVAFAVENPATVAVIPANVPTAISGLLAGLSTTGSGVLSNTTYSTNVAPDLIAKVAFDPGYGHYEVKALGRFYRDRLTSTTTAPGSNRTVEGGGLGAAAFLPLGTRRADFLIQGTYGNIGRYGAQQTDVIIKPNGMISPEKSFDVLTGVILRPTPKLDVYTFMGGEYLYRNHGYGLASIDNTKCYVEATIATYSCGASTKDVAGDTSGFWYRFAKGGFGTVQYGMTYEYIYKNTWSGKGGAPRGIENVVMSSFRYYLP